MAPITIEVHNRKELDSWVETKFFYTIDEVAKKAPEYLNMTIDTIGNNVIFLEG